MLRSFFMALVACVSLSLHAATIEQPLENPQQEAIARAMFNQLRCVVCEGQSIADSDATLAREMRNSIREKLAAGQSREEIMTFFRSRYGDAIVMTPPFNPHTLFLWLAPLLVLAVGAVFVWRAARPQGSQHD